MGFHQGSVVVRWEVHMAAVECLVVVRRLRIHAAIPDMPDNLHDQGIAVLDPNIFRDLEPSSIKEFSGAMRFPANIIKNRNKLEKCP